MMMNATSVTEAISEIVVRPTTAMLATIQDSLDFDLRDNGSKGRALVRDVGNHIM